MKYRCSVLTLGLVLTVTAALGAQAVTGKARGVRPGQLAISRVDDQSVGDEPMSIEPNRKIALAGTLVVGEPVERVAVQAVIVRRYDGHVWMTPKAHLTPSRGRGASTTWTWKIPDVDLPESELGAGYDVEPVVFADDPGLSGVTDRETIRRLSIAHGAVVRLMVASGDSLPIAAGACHLQIDTVENVFGQPVPATGAEIEVGLSSVLQGTFDAPARTYLYAGVRPDSTDRVWIMPANITRAGRHYRATAYAGREGLDFGASFSIQTLLTRQPIAEDRAYTADEFRAIEPVICATSREVIVRRRIAPGDLRITKVDNIAVTDGTTTFETTSEPQVEGQVEDQRRNNILDVDEVVYVLTRQVGTEGWFVTGLAIVHKDRLGWRVPALRLPQPGTYQVMAVAARTRLPLGQALSADNWYRLARLRLMRRISKAVLIQPKRQ